MTPAEAADTPADAAAEREARVEAFWESVHALAPRPLVTGALVAVTAAIFVALLFAGAGVFRASPDVLLRWGANFAPATLDGQPWRLATSMFLHFGAVHLAFNLWALWDAGRLLERLYGSAAFLGLYVFAGICGGMASLWWNGSKAVSAGASAAVFGLYGALFGYLAIRRHAIPREVLGSLGASAAVFIAFSLFIGALVNGIDNAAHLGGLAAGFLAGVALTPGAAGRSRARSAGCAAAALAVAAGLWTVLPAPAYTQREQATAEAAMRAFLDREAETVRLARTVLDPLKRGEITPAAAADRLEAEVVPQWVEAHRLLSAITLPEAAPNASRLKLMLRYTAVRREMLSELAQGLRLDDAQRLEHANRLAAESHRLLDELQRQARRPL